MDAASPELFGAIKQRLRWLGQRQEVLARNIANSDTPGYRPRDLRQFTFSNMVGEHAPGDRHDGHERQPPERAAPRSRRLRSRGSSAHLMRPRPPATP